MAVKVSSKVLEGLEAVRSSGQINMLDRPGVQKIAHDMGYHDTVLWIEENKKDYARGIFEGFEAEAESVATDKEMADALTKEWPPTNKTLLDRWQKETKNPVIRKAISQWIDVLDKRRGLMDFDVYERLMEIKGDTQPIRRRQGSGRVRF